MKLAVVVGLGLVLINVEAGLLHVVGATLVKVDLGLVVIAFMALNFQPLEAAVGAFFVGYFLDLLSGHPTGLYAFLAVLVCLGARFAGAAVDVRGPLGFSAFAALTSFAYHLLSFLFTWWAADEGEVRGAAAVGAALPTAFWTALTAFPLFFLLRWVEAKFTREEPGLLH